MKKIYLLISALFAISFSASSLAGITVKNTCNVAISASYVSSAPAKGSMCGAPFPTALIPAGESTVINVDPSCANYSVWILVGYDACTGLTPNAVVTISDITGACLVCTVDSN